VKNAEQQIQLETSRALQQIRQEAVDLSLAWRRSCCSAMSRRPTMSG
jgi:F0F1-type ATP synthase membrane subunit b/b'